MTKKRFLAMLLTGAMTLSLAACGGTSTGSDAGTDSGADSGSDSYKIALIQQHQTNEIGRASCRERVSSPV